MEDMKMVTINEIDSDSYYWDENEETIEGVDQLKMDWNDLPVEKRTGLFTLKNVPFEIDARSVLEELYEKLAESEQGYEDTYDCLENDTTDEYVKELQDVLETVKNNVGNLTKAVQLMDKKIDDLQAGNEKLKEELAVVKKTVKSI